MKMGDNNINNNQFFDLITGEEISWQAIIYDLIKTEQLDPWDIDLSVLADRYVDIIQKMEEANFLISSKVLLACSLILRLKSQILTEHYIKELDEALNGGKESKKYEVERMEIDEDELPLLVPRTPIPRHRKVTLNELISALNKAIDTENRRIRKEIKVKQTEKSALVLLPREDRIPLKDRVKSIYSLIKSLLEKPNVQRITYSEIAPSREEKISSFLPVLHLSNNERLYLNQSGHFEEIYLMLEKMHEDVDELKREIEEINEDIDEKYFDILEEEPVVVNIDSEEQ